MQYYRIAGLNVSMEASGRTEKQAIPYLCEPFDTPDIRIPRTGEKLHAMYPEMSLDDCEYLSTGGSFYHQLLNFDGMMIHASAVVMDGKAYLFSAPCGTGKSTHTALWQQVFGPERAQILNDDKPAIRCIDGVFYAFGTPWSGKYDISLNTSFPLAGICMLSRGEENRIVQCAPEDVILALAEQTLRPRNPERMDHLLTLLDKLLTSVPIWKLQCNMDPEAARISHAAMSGQTR